MRHIAVLAVTLAAIACLLAAPPAHAVPFAVMYTDADGVGFKDASLGPQRKAAFEAALSYWGNLYPGTVPILLNASWVSAGSGSALAASGVGIQWADFPYAPKPGIAYVPALVNQFYGSYYSYNLEFPDIRVQFNLDYPWYYGTDGNAPSNQFDFYHTALHELCHGLGFQSNIQPDGSWYVPATTVADSFSVNLESGGRFLTDMTPAERKTAVTSPGLTFMGPEIQATTAGQGVAMLTFTNQFVIGSTADHVADSFAGTYDQLMTSGTPPGPVYDGAGPKTLHMMRDLGWNQVLLPSVQTLPPLVGTPSGKRVTFRAIVNPNGKPTNVRFEVTTNGTAQYLYYAGPLPGDNVSHAVSMEAPFDIDPASRYNVQAWADYAHYYVKDANSFNFVGLTPGPGAMLSFGAAQSLTVSSLQGPSGAQPFTMEAWVNPGAPPASGEPIAALGADGPGSLRWQYSAEGNFIASVPGSGLAFKPIPANTWTHVATSYDGTTLRLYLNGALAGSTAVTPNITGNTLLIGALGPALSYNGSIDELRIWNVARSEADIRRDRYRRAFAPTPNLVSLFHFDDAAGAAPADSAGAAQAAITSDAMWAPSTAPIGYPGAAATYAVNVGTASATIQGIVDPMGLDTTAAFGWSGNVITDNMIPATPAAVPAASYGTPVSARLTGLSPGARYNFGPFATNIAAPAGANTNVGYFVTLNPVTGTALRFQSLGDAVRIPGFGLTDFSQGITIQFWQKVTKAQEQSTIVLANDDSRNRINIHTPWSDGVVYWDFGDAAGAGRLAYTPPADITGTWQQFTFVAQPADPGHGVSGAMAIYRNGVNEAAQPVAGRFTPYAADLSIGGLPAGSFGGMLDEVRIWNRPLLQAEVEANWNKTLTGNEPGLLAYWRMDEGSGAAVHDAAGHGYDGTFWSNGTAGTHGYDNPFNWYDPAWAPSDAPLAPSFGLQDVIRAVRIAGGLQSAVAGDLPRLHVTETEGGVSLADALRLARMAAG
ncbi:MAG TPA: LamG-like jellyroll fold domain-containing protein [Armatimonadota bacterium]